MKKTYLPVITLSFFLSLGGFSACGTSGDPFQPAVETALRAPAYPLVTIDPYTSAWSFTDKLNEDVVRHWTGKKYPLLGAIRVDGKSYRFMGVEDIPMQVILPTVATEKWDAVFTEKEPVAGWTSVGFNDSAWKKGKAAFGTPDMPYLSTPWNSTDIWVRRTFDLADDLHAETLFLEYSHDDIFELYINGHEVVKTGYTWKNNVLKELPPEIKDLLKPGKNVIAAHCNNKVGGGYVDFGLYRKTEGGDAFATAAVQQTARVLPTGTFYTFACGPVELDLVFTAPLLMDDLDLLSRPVNYISYQVKPLDGKAHDVQVYLEATPLWAVDTEGQAVDCMKEVKHGLSYLKTGTKEQAVLKRKGDDVRIDWGYFFLAGADEENTAMQIGDYDATKQFFAEKGTVRGIEQPTADKTCLALAYSHDLGSVSQKASGYLMIGYDDIESVQYFRENRPAYWKKNGTVDIYQAFEQAAAQYTSIMQRCRAFDKEMMQETEKAGGKEYAELCALAYRQSIAAHKLTTDKDGNLLFLSKENFSNGSTGTVDITYPSSPLYLVYNPELVKGMLNPIFHYSESGEWNKPFAAHDVGTYPQANGQTYGGDMPVEESGNMLILTTAVAVAEGNAEYAKKHWTVLTIWADYLLAEGLDPENQLCTDDFAGHFAHNTNLSIKAIMGIAGYGKLAEMLGEHEVAVRYKKAACEMARKWMWMAQTSDHYRLTFDQPNSWSQKYNLVWDRLLGLSVFPNEVAAQEVDFYLAHQNKYGLPLDSRKTYTKSDWIIWSACLAANTSQFRTLVAPIYAYAGETDTRMPLSDWHETTNGKSVGFRARSVVGGYFMKLLQTKIKPAETDTEPCKFERPALQKSELFMELPDECPTPDGMAVAPDGDLILACPNFADLTKPACLMRITKEGKISKWLDVPVLPETGRAAPMGLAFAENGDLFICDNQGWSGAEKAQNKGRLLCLKFVNRALYETVVVASGMEHPNGVRIRDGKVYVTQSALSKIKDDSGLLVSGVYCFDINDRNIRVTNTRADKNLIATVITHNPGVQYGLDGIVFDKAGNLYVGNFGDGTIHKMVIDDAGKVVDNEIWAQDPTQLRTTDGMCLDDDGNIWIADFSENAVARVSPEGTIRRIAQSPDGDGSDGGLDQPGEPIVWNGRVIVSCFDIVTGPDKTNTKHDKPFTLAALPLK